MKSKPCVCTVYFFEKNTCIITQYMLLYVCGGDEMYTIKEVAEALNFTERAVRQWVIDGKIKAVKIMSQWRIPEEEVERLKRGE